MKLTLAFERLEKALHNISPGLSNYLAPGLTKKEIEELMAGQPYCLADDVARLYQWHNGENSQPPYHWNLTGTADDFVSLQNALLDEDGYALKRELLGLDFGDEIPTELDAPGYVVLFADGGGDEIIVPCWNRQIEESPVFFSPEVGYFAVGYNCVADMINTFAACYEEGVHLLQDGEFKTDFEKLYEVSRRLNPGASHWQE